MLTQKPATNGMGQLVQTRAKIKKRMSV